MIRRSERKRRRPAFFSPSHSRPSSKEKKRARKGFNDHHERMKQQCRFDDLPPEVLEMMFRFLPYKDIAGPVRLISKKCSAVATAILNSAFLSIESRIRASMSQVDLLSTTSKNQVDRVHYSRAYDCLELLQAQYDLLRACCWRYTHPTGDRSFGRLCFYGGSILDEFDQILDDAKRNPGSLIDKDGPPSKRVAQFAYTCKVFMNYFERVSERRVNRGSAISGCKTVDLLDCLLIGKEVLSCRVSSQRNNPNREAKNATTISMKLRYRMERAWFTCLEVPDHNAKRADDSWRDQQRFMHLRLRRLVGIVNEHYLEKKHHERESKLDSDVLPSVRPLPCSTYSGYGDCGGRFYYYGNMNEYAYDSKVIEPWAMVAARDRLQMMMAPEKPHYELVIDVELRCTPELAPRVVRSMLKCDDFENTTVSSRRPQMYLKLSISCPASLSNRLPGHFVWEQRNRRRLKFR